MSEEAIVSITRRRPATVDELSEKARRDLQDFNGDLKSLLRAASLARKTSGQHKDDGDHERSFLHLTEAAIIIEKIRAHEDYNKRLTDSQRYNLILVSLILFLVTQYLRLVFPSPLPPTVPLDISAPILYFP